MRALLTLAALALMPLPAEAQMNILGPCRDGHRWMATRTGGAPVAAYASCDGARPLAIVACGTSGWPELRIAAAPGTEAPAPGEVVTGRLTIDTGEAFDLRIAPAAPIAGSGRILRVQLSGPAVEAMARGARAVLEVPGSRIEMHLGASHDVLMLFNQQC